MFMFLGLTGMVGFAVCLVVFIISLVRKRSKKPSAIGMAVCVVLFFVGLALTPPYPDKPADEKAAPVVAESSADKEEAPASSGKTEEPVSTTVEEQTAEDSAPSEAAETKGEPSETSEAAIDSWGEAIPGLLATDIKLNLKDWGIKSKTPTTGAATGDFIHDSSAVDPDTGAELTYYIASDNVSHVKYATFSVLNLEAISEEDFLGVAGGYLGYCATVPFDGAEPEKSRKWVEDNVAKCNEAGKVETLKVGGVEFSLYGNASGVRFLDIKAVKE